MDWDLDDSSIEVLIRAFQCSDIDGDGVISINDLQIASGIQDDEELEKLFFSMKSISGSVTTSQYLTFDEFRKCVIDYPFLLEQIKEGIHDLNSSYSGQKEQIVDTLSDETPRDSFCLEFKYSRDTLEAGFMIKLYGALVHNLKTFGKALNVQLEAGSAPEPCIEYDQIGDSDSIDGLVSGIRFALDSLREKTNNREQRSGISQRFSKCLQFTSEGAMQLLKLVEDAYQYGENIGEEYASKIQNLETALDFERGKVFDLTQNNDRLIHQMKELENVSQHSEKQNEYILAENQELMNMLDKIKRQEEEAQSEISDIQKLISGKEDEITQLQKEVRRLTSMKTIKEMKGTEVVPENYRKMRIDRMTPRCSVAVDSNFRFPSTPNMKKFNEDATYAIAEVQREQAFKMSKMNSDLKTKQNSLNQKELQLRLQLEEIERKHHQEIEFYQKECQKITILWKEEKLKNLSLRSASVEQTPKHKHSSSLFDELELMGESTEEETLSTLPTPMKETHSELSVRRSTCRGKTDLVPFTFTPLSTKRGRCCGIFG